MSKPDPLDIDGDGSIATLTVDESVYCVEAVRHATYWFTDRCFVTLSRSSGMISVRLQPKNEKVDLRLVASELKDALLDAQLRVEIGRETADVRSLIVAKAFAEGDLLEENPVGDWRDPVVSKESTK